MATYAAYRHVELDKVGCGKRRVLKPPGGGTSSLFAPNEDETPKPRMVPSMTDSVSVQNSHTSTTSINGMEGKLNGLGGKSGNDSVSVKEHRESEAKEKGMNVVEPLSAHDSTTSAEIQYLSAQEDKRQRDGNPVTGEGYDNPDQQVTAPARARVPPGGYSSGLW